MVGLPGVEPGPLPFDGSKRNLALRLAAREGEPAVFSVLPLHYSPMDLKSTALAQIDPSEEGAPGV